MSIFEVIAGSEEVQISSKMMKLPFSVDLIHPGNQNNLLAQPHKPTIPLLTVLMNMFNHRKFSPTHFQFHSNLVWKQIQLSIIALIHRIFNSPLYRKGLKRCAPGVHVDHAIINLPLASSSSFSMCFACEFPH